MVLATAVTRAGQAKPQEMTASTGMVGITLRTHVQTRQHWLC